ncbi:MAG: ParA family protein [Anaerolineales bacterium]|nr:ParA family protein [Anaerolineales bacterium]
MTYITALANQKGGVGKTTTAVNLSAALAAAGKRVLLVDLDPQANATSHLGYRGNELDRSVYDVLIGSTKMSEAIVHTTRLNFDLLPSSTELAGAEVELVGMLAREQRLQRALVTLDGRYHYILLDPPPSLGLLTLNALVAAHGVVVPVQAEYFALEGLSKLVNTLNMVKEQLNPTLEMVGLLVTLFDGRTNLAADVVAELQKHFAHKVFENYIPRNVRLSEAPSHGSTIFELDPRSTGAQAYARLSEEFIARVGDEAA